MTNNTRLVIVDKLSIDFESPDKISCQLSEEYSYADFIITNDGNSVANLDWSYSLPPDGWVVGFANPVTELQPRENQTVRLGIIPPANEQITDSAFKISISVSATNGDRLVEKSVILDVEIEESIFGNISLDDEILQPLLGVPKGSSQSTTIEIRNDGNVPLEGDLTIIVIDESGNEISGWRPSVSPSNIATNPGESQTVEVELNPKDSVDRGPFTVIVSLTSGDEIITTFNLQASSSPAEGNKGLFNIVPWYVSLIIVASLVGLLVIVSRKVKKSGSTDDDGTQLVTADAYGSLPDAGSRREKALDIGLSQDDMTSGEVSQEEIAAALAKSMAEQFNSPPAPNLPSVGLPQIGKVPAGMPPLGQVPEGLPPALPQKTLVNLPPPALQKPSTNIPPLPATGLPAGWTIEQWNAYGHMWLEKNQR